MDFSRVTKRGTTIYGKMTISLTGRRGSVSGKDKRSFSVSICIAPANDIDEMGRGSSFDIRKDDDPSSRLLHRFPPYGCFRGPVPSFGEYIGLQQRDESQGGWFVKGSHIVDTRQSGEEFHPLPQGKEGPPGALDLPDGIVAVDSDHKKIAQGLGFFKVTEVTHMEKVEAAIGKDHPASVSPQFPEEVGQGPSLLHLFLHLDLLFLTYPICFLKSMKGGLRG
jgi:hypothetical protein